MRAIVLTRPRVVEVVDDWPEPRPARDEVLVGIRAVGLCGSDLSVYEGIRTTPHRPWVMGHEGGGEILEVGDGVADRYVGQRVVIEPNYSCLRCRACRRSVTSACTERRILGMNASGLLSERVAVPAAFTWPVPASVPDAALACIEPLAVARAAVRRSGVGVGDECLVVGAGSQGLLLCQALLAVGARPMVTEPLESRLSLAEELGAKRFDPATHGDCPFVFDTVGEPSTWRTSLDAVADTGRIVVIGMSSAPVHFSTFDLVRRQLLVTGSLIYDHPEDFRDTVAAVAEGELAPQRVLQSGADPDRVQGVFSDARAAPAKSWLAFAAWHRDGHG